MSDKNTWGILMNQDAYVKNDTGCPLDWEDLFGRIGDEPIIEEFAAAFLKNSLTLIL